MAARLGDPRTARDAHVAFLDDAWGREDGSRLEEYLGVASAESSNESAQEMLSLLAGRSRNAGVGETRAAAALLDRALAFASLRGGPQAASLPCLLAALSCARVEAGDLVGGAEALEALVVAEGGAGAAEAAEAAGTADAADTEVPGLASAWARPRRERTARTLLRAAELRLAGGDPAGAETGVKRAAAAVSELRAGGGAWGDGAAAGPGGGGLAPCAEGTGTGAGGSIPNVDLLLWYRETSAAVAEVSTRFAEAGQQWLALSREAAEVAETAAAERETRGGESEARSGASRTHPAPCPATRLPPLAAAALPLVLAGWTGPAGTRGTAVGAQHPPLETRALAAAARCCMLALPGHPRARLVSQVLADPRVSRARGATARAAAARGAALPEETLALLELVASERLLGPPESLERFRRSLPAVLGGGEVAPRASAFSAAVTEHNLLAVSRVFRVAPLATLAGLLGCADEAETECAVAKAAIDGRIAARIDQTARVVRFPGARGLGAGGREMLAMGGGGGGAAALPALGGALPAGGGPAGGAPGAFVALTAAPTAAPDADALHRSYARATFDARVGDFAERAVAAWDYAESKGLLVG